VNNKLFVIEEGYPNVIEINDYCLFSKGLVKNVILDQNNKYTLE